MKIHIVAGLLEAGKTTYIGELLKNDRSYRRPEGSTLLLLCEEGEVELDRELTETHRITVDVFEEEPENVLEEIHDRIRASNPGQVFIEWNIMWEKDLTDLCRELEPATVTVIINGVTLPFYYSNMKQLFVNMLRPCTLTVFNRAEDKSSLEAYAQPFRLINDRAGYLWQAPMGYHEKAFEDILPYDRRESFLSLDEQQFTWFCIDAHRSPQLYYGKRIEVVVEADLSRTVGDRIFFAGRRVMVCCMADIQYMGFYCDCGSFSLPNDHDFLKLTCLLDVPEGIPRSSGLLMIAENMEPAPVPAQIIVQ